MEENNLGKEKSSNKKILKGVLIYFLLAVVVTSIYSIYNNTQYNNTQPSCENLKIIASEDFYSENLDIVLEEDNKDSEEFIINLDNNIEKSGERLVYARGIKPYFKTDILEEDIACPLDEDNPGKILLFDNFLCIKDGEVIGTVSPEVIDKMDKCD